MRFAWAPPFPIGFDHGLAALVADALAGPAAGDHQRGHDQQQQASHAISRAVWTADGRTVTAPGSRNSATAPLPSRRSSERG